MLAQPHDPEQLDEYDDELRKYRAKAQHATGIEWVFIDVVLRAEKAATVLSETQELDHCIGYFGEEADDLRAEAEATKRMAAEAEAAAKSAKALAEAADARAIAAILDAAAAEEKAAPFIQKEKTPRGERIDADIIRIYRSGITGAKEVWDEMKKIDSGNRHPELSRGTVRKRMNRLRKSEELT